MSALQEANKAYRHQQYEQAVELYRIAKSETTHLNQDINFNLALAERRLKEKAEHTQDQAVITSTDRSAKDAFALKSSREKPQSPLDGTYSRATVNPNISVIVPIFNALEDLRVCVARLIRYTPKNVRLILINDASTDKGVTAYLSEVSRDERFQVLHNEQNLGFTKTVNRGIKMAGEDDVVLLNSDARVTPRWLHGMRNALAFDSRIATVTPMSDRAGAFSAPRMGNENDLPDGVPEEQFAVLFRRISAGYYPTVPTGNGFCLYVRRSCLKDIGSFDEIGFPRGYGEENDFCMRASRAGWRNIVDDRTYVFHDRNKSFQGEKEHLIAVGRALVDERYPEYKKLTRVFAESPGLQAARKGAGQVQVQLSEGSPVKPRVLYVINSWTGGTPQTNNDLMMALTDNLEPWLLRCDARSVSLYQVKMSGEYELKRDFELVEPLGALAHVSPEYDGVVSSWLFEFDFELVHIRHIALHSLSLPRLAKQAGARVVKSFHDYYAVCPTVKLLDENQTFCGGECTLTTGDCTIDLWQDKKVLPQLKNSWVHRWREIFQSEILDYCDAFVTTHSSVKETYMKYFQIPENAFTVIPHGRDFESLEWRASDYTENQPIRVLVPGNIGAAKGRDIIKKIAAKDKGNRIEFHILGRANIKEAPGVKVYGEYSRDEFALHVSKIRPHLGAVLSIWNETWCHTLTELWSVGLPVVATDFPVVAERIDSCGAGWVLSSLEPDEIYKELTTSISRSDQIRTRTKNVEVAQTEILEHGSVKNMAQRYFHVYQGIGAQFSVADRSLADSV